MHDRPIAEVRRDSQRSGQNVNSTFAPPARGVLVAQRPTDLDGYYGMDAGTARSAPNLEVAI